MFIPKIISFNDNIPYISNKGNKATKIDESLNLRLFHHHIYELKKGIRNLVLTTEEAKYRTIIETRLAKEQIDYLIQNINENKINIFFGAKECIDIVKTFNTTKLNEITPEQDFMLGIMLGYDKIQQCQRYMKIKHNEIKLGKQSLSNQN